MIEERYIPSEESVKFIAFIRAAGVEDNANAEIHYRLADKYFGKDKQILIEAFRGSAKSTMMEWLVIYIAAKGSLHNFGSVNFIAFIGDSMENGTKNFFRNVVGKIDQSEFLQQFLKVKRKTDNEMELVNADGVELNIKGYGANTNIRGVRYKGKRPDIIILDDITTNEAKTSAAIQGTINDNFYKSVIPALHPTRFKIFFIGTPISENDIIHQLSNNPKWVVHKFPICKKFPCSKEDFEGAWEDRFTYESVLDKYEMFLASGKSQDFYQEYMLEITDLTTLLVDEDDIKWYDPSMVLKNKSWYNFYISTDFATSTKKSADYSTIGIWAVSHNNDWLLVDGQCKRQTMQENIEDLFRYVKKWKPLSVGIENSGQQGGFLSIIEEMKIQRNVWFQFAKKPGSKEPGIRPIKDKVHRFVTGVQPKFKQNKIWFPQPEMIKGSNPRLLELVDEMVAELSKFTLSGGVSSLKHDDCGTYDVVVDTPTGNKLLGEIRNGDEVIGFSALGSVVCKVKDARITGIKPIVNIELDSGEILKFSEFHPILSGNTYKLVRELSIGDTITRNTKWKQQLNMMDIHGLKNQEDTTNPQLDVQMEAEKTGFINTCMSRLMEAFQKGTKCITKTTIRKTMTSQILSYCHQQNIKLSMQSRVRLMGINLLITWQQTLMKFKHLLRKGNQENILVKIKEEKYQINQSNVRAVLQNSHLLTKHEKILNSAVIAVEMNGMGHMLKNVNVKNVEQYSNLVLEALDTVVMTAEVLTLKEQLKESLNTYAVCAEKHSQELKDRLAAEKNAQEIEKMSLNGCTDKIKRIWVTKPEPTYNFEVDQYHNYQVHNGIVVHNCIDLLNQLSEMEIYTPSEEVVEERSAVTEGGLIWTGIWEDEEDGEYGGSTIF